LPLIHDGINVAHQNATNSLKLAGNMNGLTSQLDLEGYVRQIVNFPDSSTAGSTDGVDAILAPIFKDILQNNAGREFTGLLDVFTEEKVGEIERMCNSNHQEFVGAVEKLLKARKGAAGLKVQSIRLSRLSCCLTSVLDLNENLQRSGNALTSVMRQQVENQTTLENIDEAIETLQVADS
jgi:hypothetical protein